MIIANFHRPNIRSDLLMTSDLSKHIECICRYGLGFLFVYHGLVPKIIWLSPVEISLVEASGSPFSATWLSPLAGVLEILLGVSIILFRRILAPVYIAISLLIMLLIFVAFTIPTLLIEAFNPISTNGLGVVLGYLVIKLHYYNVKN